MLAGVCALDATTYQAEDRSATSGFGDSTSNAGYTGSSYMDFGGNGTWMEWDDINESSSGTATLTFRYANGGGTNRQCELKVNGSSQGNIAFAPTGSWTTWDTVEVNVSINSGNNTVRLTANTGNGGPNLDKVDVALGLTDIEAPTAPTGLASGTVTTTTAALSWSASTDNVGVTGYKVYTNGNNPVSVTGTSTTMTGLTQYTTYAFEVTAVDAANNESNPGGAVSVTTVDGEDPSTPTGLSAIDFTDTTVSLSWNSSTDNAGVVGYKVYTNGSNPVTVSSAGATIISLTEDTTYTFTVSAYDAAGNESTVSSGLAVTTDDTPDVTAPAVPTGLSSSNVTTSSVDLSWNASSDNVGVTGYYIYTNGMNPVSSTGTSVTITGLLSGTNYSFTVSAYDAEMNESDESSGESVTTASVSNTNYQAEDYTAKSGSVLSSNNAGYTGSNYMDFGGNGTWMEWDNVNVGSGGTVTLAFRYANGDSGNRQGELKVNGSSQGNIAFAPTGSWTTWGTISVTVTFTSGDNTVRLTANTGSGGPNLDRLEVSSTSTDTEDPDAPTGLLSSNITATSVGLSWNAAVDNVGVTGYKVYTGGSSPVSVSGTSTTIEGLTQNTAYTFTVTALDAAGNESDPSSAVNPTTLDGQAPSVPSGLASSNITTSSVDLSWNASSDNVGVTGYKVYTNGSNPISVSGTSTTISGLSADTSYTFTVSALDAAGNESALSSGENVTTDESSDIDAPSVPTGLASNGSTSSSVSLVWNASSDNVGVAGYNVYIDGSNSGNVSAPGALITGLSASTSYDFTVSAYDASGNESDESGILEVTTNGVGTGTAINEIFTSGASNFTVISGGTWSVSSGKYVLSNAASASVPGTLGNISVHNAGLSNTYTITAEVTLNSTDSDWDDAAVVFGFVDSNNYYYLSMNESNNETSRGVFKVVNGIPTELIDIANTISSGFAYVVEITRDGSSIVVKLNNMQVASVSDSTFIGGKVGFGSYNDGASFDNLVVGGELDEVAPSVPTGLAASNVTANSVDLDWNVSTDNVGVAGYQIYIDGSDPIEVDLNSVTLTGLDSTTEYDFTVSAYDATGNESAQSSPAVTVTTLSQVATPQYSPAGGYYENAQSVSITTATSGATIRYTTDGSTPTVTSGTVYTGTISISAHTTLKAIAYKSGMADSPVVSAFYAIGTVPTPTRTPSFGPNGSHWPGQISGLETPFMYDATVPNQIEVDPDWSEIKSAINGLTSSQVSAGVLIKVRPGTLVGYGSGGGAPNVMEDVGNSSWTKRVTVCPRDGWGTVTITDSLRLNKIRNVCFAGFIINGKLRMVSSTRFAWAWSLINGRTKVEGVPANESNPEMWEFVEWVFRNSDKDPEDPMQLQSFDGIGKHIQGVVLDGIYLAPCYLPIGSKAHQDTIQHLGFSGWAFQNEMVRDSAIFGSGDSAVNGGLRDSIFRHSFICGRLSAQSSRYPLHGGSEMGDYPAASNGSVGSITFDDCIIIGKLRSNTGIDSTPYDTVINGSKIDYNPTGSNAPTSGEWIVDTTMDGSNNPGLPTLPDDAYLQSIWGPPGS